jgi:raffinose/stachyose/melibiose transport system substrate-binding protein
MPFSPLSRRRLLQLSGAGIAAGTLSWLGQPAFAQGASVKVWDQFSDEPPMSTFGTVLDDFSKKTGIKIERNVQNGGQISNIAATALASGTGPDILQYSVGKGNAGLLADAGLLVPLTDYAAKYKWQERLSPIAMLEAQLNDKLWGAPQETEVSLFFVNRSLFEQHGWDLPKSQAEMVALAKEASKAGVTPIAYGEQDFYPSWWALSHVASNVMGAKAAGDLVYNNKGSFNTPEMVDGINSYWVELREAGAFIPQVNALAAADAQALFQSGGALLLMSGTWAAGNIESTMPKTKLDIMPMWALTDKPRAYPTGSGSAMYISAASKVKDEAAQLLDYLYSPEAAKLMIEKASIIAPVPMDASSLSLSDFQKRSVSAVTSGDGDPKVNQGVFVNHGLSGSNFHQMMTNGFQAMMAGQKTAKQQAADLQTAWEKDNS